VIDRLFGSYPDLAYADALREGRLPPNVEIIEYLFLAGRGLRVSAAQQNFISANYTRRRLTAGARAQCGDATRRKAHRRWRAPLQASLVPDGGTLQIGNGQIGDALAQGLMLRHRNGGAFHDIMTRLSPARPAVAQASGVFDTGLCGVSEMLTEAHRPDRCRHSQARSRRRRAAWRFLPRSEVFYRALREMAPDQSRLTGSCSPASASR
jgi:hypothetical protein